VALIELILAGSGRVHFGVEAVFGITFRIERGEVFECKLEGGDC
jgi:hypothetical protein